MTWLKSTLTVLILATVLAVTACGGGGGSPTSEPQAVNTADPIEQSVRQTVAALTAITSVAQTVEALTGNQSPTVAPLPTTEISPPTVEVQPSATPTSPGPVSVVTEAPAPTAEQARNCVTASSVNVRSGPGQSFDPPLGSFSANTALTPVSFVANGFPGGSWLEVQSAGNGQTVWISAEPRFVSCDFDLGLLPGPSFIASTPRPTSTPTPLALEPTRIVAGLPPDVRNNGGGGACDGNSSIDAPAPDVDPNYLFRVKAKVAGTEHDGDGIESVTFEVARESDDSNIFFTSIEQSPKFCIFKGGEPDCNNWFYNDQGQFTWGQGGPIVEPDDYRVFITILAKFIPENGSEEVTETCNWNLGITVNP